MVQTTTYNKEEMMNMAKVKLERKNTWRDIHKVTYYFEKCFPYHVLFKTQFGYKRCFTYAEVVNALW